MSNRLGRALIVGLCVVALCVGSTAVFAQAGGRIEFSKSKTSETLKGAGNQSYVIRVGARQACKIKLTSARNAATLEVLDPKGSDLTEGSDGRSFEGAFAVAGDYRINVTAKGKTTFTLSISVKDS